MEFRESHVWTGVFERWGKVRVVADGFDEAVNGLVAVAVDQWDRLEPKTDEARARLIRVVRIAKTVSVKVDE